jgi:hypothetical protein
LKVNCGGDSLMMKYGFPLAIGNLKIDKEGEEEPYLLP